MIRKADAWGESDVGQSGARAAGETRVSVPAKSSALTKDRGVEVMGRRVLASLIDCSLVTPLSSVAFAPLLFVQPGLILVLVLLLSVVLLFCIFYVAYVALFESFRGQTPGKILIGIAMIREVDGGALGPGRAALRALVFRFAHMIS
jgi:uncharacterized RDD family membrane protein YckC